jgi:DNA polymerase-3 subunit beta
MKLSITQENLNHGLSTVSRIIGNRNTLPVLANVLLQTKDNRIQLSATNLEMGITHWIGGKVEEDGAVTIPAKLFSEYVHNLPAGNVSLTKEKDTVHIDSNGFSSKINGISAEEFPSIPSVSGNVEFQVAAKTLKNALSQVVHVTSGDDSRPVLTGVYLHARDGMLYAVATDSYRLAEKQIMETDTECNVVVPARTVTEVLRLLGDSEDVTVKIDDNQISFGFNETELVSRIIDGEFPDYRQLIPQEVPTTARVNTGELQDITKAATLFARETTGSVTVKIARDSLYMESVASQVGENSSEISGEVSGEDMEVALNGKYIADALSVIDTDQVDISLTGKVNPCLIQPVDDDSYLHIVMPLRS